MTPTLAYAHDESAIDDIIASEQIAQLPFQGTHTIDPQEDDAATPGLTTETFDAWPPTAHAAQLEQLRASVNAELERYANYRRGWDGYDGEPFTHAILNRARLLAWAFTEQFSVAGVVPIEMTTGPASDGSLDLEIGTGSKSMILTLHPHSRFVVLYREADGKATEEVSVLSPALLVRLIHWFLHSDVHDRVLGTH